MQREILQVLKYPGSALAIPNSERRQEVEGTLNAVRQELQNAVTALILMDQCGSLMPCRPRSPVEQAFKESARLIAARTFATSVSILYAQLEWLAELAEVQLDIRTLKDAEKNLRLANALRGCIAQPRERCRAPAGMEFCDAGDMGISSFGVFDTVTDRTYMVMLEDGTYGTVPLRAGVLNYAIGVLQQVIDRLPWSGPPQRWPAH